MGSALFFVCCVLFFPDRISLCVALAVLELQFVDCEILVSHINCGCRLEMEDSLEVEATGPSH